MAAYPGSSEAFYNLALECSLRRSRHQCHVEFDAPQCNQCRIYFRKFANTDDSTIKMLLHQTDTEAAEIKHRQRIRHAKLAALILLIIGLSLWGWNHNRRSRGLPLFQFERKPVPTQTKQIINPYSILLAPLHNTIDYTLRFVDQDIRTKE